MTPAERYRELLAVVETARERRCAEIAAGARTAAERIVREARREALRRSHAAFAELRSRAQAERSAAAAALETARRVQRFRLDRALVAQGMGLLRPALERRWADPAARAEWHEAALEVARQRLPPGTWTIEHAPGLTGVRVRSGGACVDGSLEGLLADGSEIEARLLAQFGDR